MAELLALPRQDHTDAFILVLDQVQDPHNFGALLRTAEAAGVQAAIVPDRRSAPLSGTVAKTSAGALSHLPILEVKNLVRALDDLRQAGIWVIGLDAAAHVSLFETDLAVPLALVIGGEGEGLRRLTREHCDLLLKLPMRGAIESLNASVAGSIALFEGVRQREGRGKRVN
jgi:23S rRNA (guanosine2251-2'-O)-methyltransferase